MFKNRERLYQVYHTVLCMALTWALILVINQFYNLRVFFLLSAVYTVIPSVLIYLFDINRKNAISYFLLGGIIPVVALIFWITRTNPLTWFRDMLDWCYFYDKSEELYNARHAYIVLLLATCLIAILFYLLTKRQLLKILLSVILLAAMVVLAVRKIHISKPVICISIFYILTIIVELYGIVISHKTGRQDKKEGILYLAPICLLLAVLSVAMPSKDEPIQWKTVKSIYNKVVEQIEVWKTDLDYYFGNGKGEVFLSLTGYSDDNGELENKQRLETSSKVALKVNGQEKNKSVYLIGSISDVYTGRSWEKSKTNYQADDGDYRLDFIEMYYALSRQDLDVLENNRFMEREAIKVTYNNIKTKTFFYPDKMIDYEFFSKYRKLKLQAPQIDFAKARGKGTSYQAIYYEMNLQGEAFAQMLKEEDLFSYQDPLKIDEEAVLYVSDNIFTKDGLPDIELKDYYEILKERAQSIKAQYTELPAQLPDRVYDLAEEITAEYETKYEKLKAIEAYLMQRYTYSTDPKELPEGEDYVDNFLFESKYGYCTSFATSMAVLGRCIGIPTRYVQGYIAKFDEKDSNGSYLIRNSSAHAWAEAYIEGVGWIPFEATAPFFDVRYTKWKEITQPGSGTSAPALNPYDFYPKEDTGSDLALNLPKISRKDNSDEIMLGVIMFFSIIAVLLLTLIIYYNVLRYRYKKEYEKADRSRKMYMLFLRILRLLKREGFVLGQQETIQMLSVRVRDIFKYNQVTFPDVANIFMRCRYAQEAVTKTELEMVATFMKGLSYKEREEESRIKVWLAEIIFLTKKSAY